MKTRKQKSWWEASRCEAWAICLAILMAFFCHSPHAAQHTIASTDSLNTGRTAINSNFTELYTAVLTNHSSGHLRGTNSWTPTLTTSLATLTNYLRADLTNFTGAFAEGTLTNINAGRYFITANVPFDTPSSGTIIAAICTNGVTTEIESIAASAGAGVTLHLAMNGVVVLGTNTQISIRAKCSVSTLVVSVRRIYLTAIQLP